MESRVELLLLKLLGEDVETLNPQSRIEEILYSIINDTAYIKDPMSRIEAIALAIKEQDEYTRAALSRIEEILLAILNDTNDYDLEPQSPIEADLIRFLGEWVTKTGAIVSFTTDQVVPELRELTAYIDPVQDLHGYANPWPAGGGVNVYNLASSFTEGETIENNGITAKFSNGYLKVTGTNTSGSGFNIIYRNISGTLGAGTYISPHINCSIRASIDSGSNANYNYSFTAESSVSLVSFYVTIGASATDIDWNIPMMIVKGASRPTSYSNICPISGWTGAKVMRTGKNVWDEDVTIGEINNTTGESGSGTLLISNTFIPVVPGCTYYWKSPYGGTRYFYKKDKTFLQTVYGTANASFTVPAEAYFMKFKEPSVYGNVYNHDISINYPSTDHDYHAYQGTTYPVSWQTEAGTVYGGTLDVVSGVLTVTMVINSLSGRTWTMETTSNGNVFSCNALTGVTGKALNYNFICNKYKNAKTYRTNLVNGEIGCYNSSGGRNRFSICDNAYSSTSDFVNSLSDFVVCYELATPITYHLTPHEIHALLGQNNIWADTGNVKVIYHS